MACHIASAAGGPGARRYIGAMTREERRHVDNGIWMCSTHGTLVDTDEERFTVEMIRAWRRMAETRARIEHEIGRTLFDGEEYLIGERLVEQRLQWNGIGAENEAIGQALIAAGLPAIWGNSLTHAVRDVVVELSRNAFQHGSATQATINIDVNRVRLTTDGAWFDPLSLLDCPNASGGAWALAELLTAFRDRVVFAPRRLPDQSEIVISRVVTKADVLAATDCALSLPRDQLLRGSLHVDLMEGCRVVYVVLPEFASISDVAMIARRVASELSGKRIIFVGAQVSAGVEAYVGKFVAGCGFLRIGG